MCAVTWPRAMAGKKKVKPRKQKGGQANSGEKKGATACSSSVLEGLVRVKIFYVEESFNLAIDCPLDQTFEKLLPEAYKQCVRVYNDTFGPSVPVTEKMFQLMPSGPVGDMSVKEWCEAGFYLLCRIDPFVEEAGLLWEKQRAEERNWSASFEGLLTAESLHNKKVSAAPSSAATSSAGPSSAPSSAAPSSATGSNFNKQVSECQGCALLVTKVSELETKLSAERAERKSDIAKLTAKIAPLKAVVVKHNKILRRICLDAAKAKVVELAKSKPNNETWRQYLVKLSQESIAAIQPPLSQEAWYLLDLGAQPLNWAAHNAPLHEIAAAVLDATERKDGWLELFRLGFGMPAADALAWEDTYGI